MREKELQPLVLVLVLGGVGGRLDSRIDSIRIDAQTGPVVLTRLAKPANVRRRVRSIEFLGSSVRRLVLLGGGFLWDDDDDDGSQARSPFSFSPTSIDRSIDRWAARAWDWFRFGRFDSRAF